MCMTLGVPLAPEKTEGPAQRIKYLSLELDAVQKQIQVPSSKVQATRRQINHLAPGPHLWRDDRCTGHLKECVFFKN